MAKKEKMKVGGPVVKKGQRRHDAHANWAPPTKSRARPASSYRGARRNAAHGREPR